MFKQSIIKLIKNTKTKFSLSKRKFLCIWCFINNYVNQGWNHLTRFVTTWEQQSKTRANLNWRRPSLNVKEPFIRNFLTISLWPKIHWKLWVLVVEVSVWDIRCHYLFKKILFSFSFSPQPTNTNTCFCVYNVVIKLNTDIKVLQPKIYKTSHNF